MKIITLVSHCIVSLSVAAAYGQGVTIDHQPVGCLVADHFPEMTACFQPSSDVARARLQFRAAGTLHWYFVEMQAGGACSTAILPKPQSSTKAIEYYIDVASKGYAESRTPDYAPRVASGLGGCKRRGLVAGFATTGAVTVFAPLGAPAVPAGFSSAGVTTVAGAATGPGASGMGGGGGPASSASTGGKKGDADKTKVKSGGGGGGGAALAIVALGAAGAGVYYATKKDPADVDDDGDGVSENEGDCDDNNREVSPKGGFKFTVDFAWSGSISCAATNPRAQTYRVQNNSCEPITVHELGLARSGSGPLCPTVGSSTEKLNVGTTTVPSGATMTIRTGAAAGTAGTVCCQQTAATARGLCPTGTCTVNETYTVRTSAGSATSTNSFQVSGPNGCPSCGTADDWAFTSSAPGTSPMRDAPVTGE